jgi:predicted transposase YdaD
LYEQDCERQDILNLLRFIDWVITLAQDLEIRFRQELEQYEREAQMPYVTSIEQIAKQEGMQEGRREGLLSGIELALELKFGSEGAQVLPEIAQIEDIDTLKAIQSGLRQVDTLPELRSIYQSAFKNMKDQV